MNNQSYHNNQFFSLLRYFYTTLPLYLCVVFATVYMVFMIASNDYHVTKISADFLTTQAQQYLFPERQEQIAFILSVLAMPFVTLVFAIIFSRRSVREALLNSNTVTIYSSIGVCAVAGYILYGSDFFQILLGRFEKPSIHVIRWWVLCTIATYISLYAVPKLFRRSQQTNGIYRTAKWVLTSIMLLIGGQAILWRIFSVNAVNQDDVWWRHIDPVLFTFSQVAGGKVTLIEFPSMYGLFAEFFRPIFYFITPSLLNITLLFGVLQGLSMIALAYVVCKLIKNALVKYTTVGTLIACTYSLPLFFSGLSEPYFQYWPIRFLFPSISVLCFTFFSIKRSLFRASLVSCAGAVGTIWNLDSGLAIVLAFAAYLVWQQIYFYSPAFRVNRTDNSYTNMIWNYKTGWLALILHILILLSVFGGAAIYLEFLAAGRGVINYSWIFEAHNIFSTLGYYLMPMPIAPSPWMLIVSVYAASLFWATAAYWSGVRTPIVDIILYLSLIGIGLFIYYQGRSHTLNLVCVFWPAVLIFGIVGDSILRIGRLDIGNRSSIVISVFIISILLFLSVRMAFNSIELSGHLLKKLEERDLVIDNIISDELAFIKSKLPQSSDCLILAKRQGIYQAESGLVSQYVGPGVGELVLASDESALKSSIKSRKFRCIFLGQATSEVLAAKSIVNTITENYELVDFNKGQTLLLFEIKSK